MSAEPEDEDYDEAAAKVRENKMVQPVTPPEALMRQPVTPPDKLMIVPPPDPWD